MTDERGWTIVAEWDVGDGVSQLPCCAVNSESTDYRTTFPKCPLVLQYRRHNLNVYSAAPGTYLSAAEVMDGGGFIVGSYTTKAELLLRCTLHGGGLQIIPNPEFLQALLNASIALAQENQATPSSTDA